MRKILLIAIALFGINFVSAQTNSERKAISADYNQSKIKNFEKQLEERKVAIQNQIDDYVSSHNIERRYTNENGVLLEIKYIIDGRPVYLSTNNVNSAKATRTDFLHNGGGLGLNIEGQNMHIATWDGGPTLSTHQEFLDESEPPVSRVTTPDASASNDQSNHSTHVSGTITANGTQANAKGMAPKATLTSYDWDNDDLEALNEANTNGLLLSNHSYGIPVAIGGTQNAPTWMMGCYSSDAAIWDNVAYNAPYYLMVVSAGNDGLSTYDGGILNNYDKLTTNKNCKNNLVVANASNPLINPDGSGDLLSLFINSNSSQGPSDDGRIKPDISGDGTSVYSPISTSNSGYATYNGTSMSAPNVSGSLLLLQQYYNQLNGNYMRASTLKGLACHTADDNNSSIGPDAIFGWGLLNSKVAAETIEDTNNGTAVIYEDILNNGATFTTDVTIGPGETLSATLCWTDPPALSRDGQLNSSDPVLINDLDLRITDESSMVSFPWKLQLSNVAGLAIKGDNIVDNVERVDIDNAPAGTYTISITHKGTLTDAMQNYSLIVTGADLTTTLSVDEFNATSNLSVWPNPANEILNYSFVPKSNDAVNVSLIDIQGRVVFNNTYNDVNASVMEGSIALNGYADGMYFLNIQQGQSKVYKKVIIE